MKERSRRPRRCGRSPRRRSRIVREYRGAHSGEHGDGLVRSEFHDRCSAPASSRAFEEVKDAFDPHGLLNPGKIVRGAAHGRPQRCSATRRATPPLPLTTALDWSDVGRPRRRRRDVQQQRRLPEVRAAASCAPRYRATRDEQHVTRGRANTLRLALTGQLGPDALVSDAMRRRSTSASAARAAGASARPASTWRG